MTSQAITTEIQRLAPSAVIELFVLDLSLFNEGVVRFHAGTNELRRQVIWQGNALRAVSDSSRGV
jgi:phage-related protein